MLEWLSEVDLPARLQAVLSPLITRVLTGVVFAGLAIGLRYALQQIAAGVAPFSLVFPAVLLATMVSGWPAGVVTLTLAAIAVWRLFLIDPPGAAILSLHDLVELALFTGSAGALIFLTDAFVEGARAAAKRREREIRRAVNEGERQRWIAQEMNHRVKNTLAIVQSLARQSFRGERATPAAKDEFTRRLQALAAAHDLLMHAGAEPLSISEVVGRATAGFADGGAGRILIEGPELRVSPEWVSPLTLALHELATNAAKHGALSAPGGLVRISWSQSAEQAGPAMRLVWKESGGPPVKAPAGRGFGSQLLQRGLAQDLGATISLDFAPAGVVCTIVAPFHPPTSPCKGAAPPDNGVRAN